MSFKTVQRFGLALGAIFFGFSVLVVSLIVTSQVISSGGQPMGAKKFYFASDIKPDHILYPVFMAFDRLKLETATPEEQVLLELVYAERRFAHAEELMKQGDIELAASTFSKSQKYLLSAAQNAKNLDLDQLKKQKISDLILIKSQKIVDASMECSDSQKDFLIKLVDETELAAKDLEG